MRTKNESFVEAQAMLAREEDWDDEGALPLNPLTYNRTVEWIEKNVNDNDSILSPRVSLGRDGSIDLDWYNGDYCLLLNIINQEELEIHYYGCKWAERGTAKTLEEIRGIVRIIEIDEQLKSFLNQNFKR